MTKIKMNTLILTLYKKHPDELSKVLFFVVYIYKKKQVQSLF